MSSYSPPVRPKHPLTISQICRLTGRSLDDINDAVRSGKLRLTVYFERSRRVAQADFETWLRSEGLLSESGEVADDDQ